MCLLELLHCYLKLLGLLQTHIEEPCFLQGSPTLSGSSFLADSIFSTAKYICANRQAELDSKLHAHIVIEFHTII